MVLEAAQALCHPDMGGCAGLLLPLLLQQLQHYRERTRLDALRAATRVVDESDPSVLARHGWDGALYASVQTLLGIREPPTAAAAYACLAALLRAAPQPDRLDASLRRLLRDMEFETSRELQLAYNAALVELAAALGWRCTKHLRILRRVLSETQLASLPSEAASQARLARAAVARVAWMRLSSTEQSLWLTTQQ